MKIWKHTLLSAMAFLGVAATVLYTSCEKDTCEGLNCQNGGSCAEGFCRCPTGYEGTECETMAGTKFVGKFIGNYTCPSVSPLKDTVEIWFTQQPNKVKFVQYSRIHDTIAGTAIGTDLFFETQTSGGYRKYTKATVQNLKLTVFLDEVFNINTGEKLTCNFIGFR